MKYFYTLYIWTVGVFLFVVIAFITILALQFIRPQKYSPVFKLMMRFLLRVMFIRVKITGKERLKNKTTYLYMPNHTSFIDAILLTAFLPEYTIAIEEERNLRYPIYGWLSKWHGNIPINRRSIIGSKKSFAIAEEKLINNQNLIIFPEGGRTINGKLKPFKKLLFRTANRAGRPIIPVGLKGVYEMSRKGSIWIHPKKIMLNFGAEISADEVKNMGIDELMDKTRVNLLDALELDDY